MLVGQPNFAYLEWDGYTEFKTRIPKEGKYRTSKGSSGHLGNRLIGCIITCGQINTKFMYSLNDLISGGANTMIEIVRQSK